MLKKIINDRWRKTSIILPMYGLKKNNNIAMT